MNQRSRRGEPRVMILAKFDGRTIFLEAFNVLRYNAEKKKVGFRGDWHDPQDLVKNFRMPCVDDAKLLRARGWKVPAQAEADAMWEQGYEMVVEDLVALAWGFEE